MPTEQVAAYVEENEKQSFEAHAKAADQTLSEWVAEACREKVDREGVADRAQRYRVEQRILALVDDAADRAADRITEEVIKTLREEGPLSNDSDSYDWGENR